MSSLWKASILVAVLLSGSLVGVKAQPPDTGLPALGQAYRPSPGAAAFYHILVAELAVKHERLDIALEHYQLAALSSNDPAIAGRAASIALFLGDNKTLLEMARRWQTQAPDSPPARQMLALALLRNAQFEEAVTQLDAIRAAAAADGQEGFATVGSLLNQMDDKELALRALEELHKRQPQSAFAVYQYALVARNLKRYDQALEALQATLSRNSQWAPAYLLQARLLLDKGDKEAALKSLTEAVNALPANRELRTGYARLLVDARRMDEARRQFQILAEQNPKDPDTLFALGVLATDARQYDEAVARLMQVLQLGARTPDVYYQLGRIEELRKNYAKAKEWYARVNSEERFLSAQVRMGLMLAKMDDFAAMGGHFDRLRQNEPQDAISLFVSEAEVLRDVKHYQQAYDLLDKALAQNPDSKELLYSRALMAERIDRLDVLERDLRILIAADPKNGQALNALGYTLADRTDRYQEAMDYLQQAIALLPEDPAVIDSMGWVLYRLGQYDKSLEHLRRAYELNEDDEIAAHLVEVLWVSGRQQEARELWQRASEKQPDSDYLRQVKERFSL